ncbi:MAG: hypothetical protein WC730_00410 [Patescibacteria group bacterium]|jgi:hypothetical protein
MRFIYKLPNGEERMSQPDPGHRGMEYSPPILERDKQKDKKEAREFTAQETARTRAQEEEMHRVMNQNAASGDAERKKILDEVQVADDPFYTPPGATTERTPITVQKFYTPPGAAVEKIYPNATEPNAFDIRTNDRTPVIVSTFNRIKTRAHEIIDSILQR